MGPAYRQTVSELPQGSAPAYAAGVATAGLQAASPVAVKVA
jgi:hypothetical protein